MAGSFVVWMAVALIGPEIPIGRDYGPTLADERSPDVAFDGTGYLVIWSAGLDLVAARVDASGAVLDPLGILVSEEGGTAAVAWDGTDYLVVWSTAPVFGPI